MKRYLDAILVEIKADRRKAIALSSVLVLGLLLWGRLLIRDDVPRVATATPEQIAATTTPPSAAPPTVADAADRPDVNVRVPAGSPRNLFAFDPSPYRPTPNAGLGQRPTKLPTEETDELTRKQLVVREARQLSLQSVVNNGVTNQALIDGRLVGVGEHIDGFEVVSVQERSVVLRKQGTLVRIGL
ncbi:MAG: hypothetical protein AAGB29_03445 [Planctomycetota bacterium]